MNTFNFGDGHKIKQLGKMKFFNKIGSHKNSHMKRIDKVRYQNRYSYPTQHFLLKIRLSLKR